MSKFYYTVSLCPLFRKYCNRNMHQLLSFIGPVAAPGIPTVSSTSGISATRTTTSVAGPTATPAAISSTSKPVTAASAADTEKVKRFAKCVTISHAVAVTKKSFVLRLP